MNTKTYKGQCRYCLCDTEDLKVVQLSHDTREWQYPTLVCGFCRETLRGLWRLDVSIARYNSRFGIPDWLKRDTAQRLATGPQVFRLSHHYESRMAWKGLPGKVLRADLERGELIEVNTLDGWPWRYIIRIAAFRQEEEDEQRKGRTDLTLVSNVWNEIVTGWWNRPDDVPRLDSDASQQGTYVRQGRTEN